MRTKWVFRHVVEYYKLCYLIRDIKRKLHRPRIISTISFQIFCRKSIYYSFLCSNLK
jgi:hypothetical protein